MTPTKRLLLLSGAGYSAQATAFFARAQPMSAAQKSAYDTMFRAIAGILPKLDYLHALGGPDTTTVKENLVSSSYRLTQFGTPTWITNRCYKGSGSSYLDTGFNPATAGGRWTQTSASFGVYFVDLTVPSVQEFGADVGRILVQSAPQYTPRFLANASSNFTGAVGNSNGLRSISRSGTALTEYCNGVQVSTGTASSSGFGYGRSLLIGACNNAGTVSFGQNAIAFVFGGQELSGAEMATLSSAFDAYLAAVDGLKFYVDLSAGVNGDGTLASPWNVLTTPNSWWGDLRSRTLYLKRGTSARTALTLVGQSSAALNKNVTVDAYGSGEMPRLIGSDVVTPANWTLDSAAIYYLGSQAAMHQAFYIQTVTGWTLDSGSIYYLASENQSHQYYVDGVRLQSVKAKSLMTAGTQFWDNAAQRLYIKTAASDDPAGHTVTRDYRLWYVDTKAHMTAGTQFYDSVATRLYVWLPDSSNPASGTMEITARKAFKLNFHDTGTVRNTWSDKSDDNGFEVHFSKSVTVEYCLATNFGADPISDATGFDMWGANTLQATGYITRYCESAFGANCAYQEHYTTGAINTGNYWHDCQQGVEYWDTADGPALCYGNTIMDLGFGLPANVLFTGHANALWLANDSGSSIHDVLYYSNLITNINSEVFIIDAGAARIRNNTVYQLVDGRAGQKVLKAQKLGTPTVTVNYHNNIIHLGASVTKDMMDIGNAGASVTSDYNTFYVAGGTPTFYYGGVLQASFAAYKVASSQDAHSIVTDPLLVAPTNADLGIQTGSPAAAAGTASFVATADFLGAAFGTPPNMGAYAGLNQ